MGGRVKKQGGQRLLDVGCFSSRGSGERALRTGFGEGGDGGGGEGVINGRGGVGKGHC